VHQAEQLDKKNPITYRRRVAFLAILGYAVFCIILLSQVAILAGTFWLLFATGIAFLLLKIQIVIAAFAGILLLTRAMWIRIEAPSGYRLTCADSPKLHGEIDAMSKQLNIPAIHEVLLTRDFNASLAQTPRFGIFGGYRNTLSLGIGLLLTLPVEQARSRVALRGVPGSMAKD
jgi:hypothetical protein